MGVGRPEDAARGVASPAARTSLREIAGLFLKLGTIAFGGPAAHIAMMEDEVVHRRRWLTREQFLDYLGATNLIPGPNSTELAIHIGHARAGWWGLLVAGTCFILPAALLVGAIAWAYVRFGTLPAVAGILYGVKPVVIAVVLQALWRLARTAVKDLRLAALGFGCLAATALGMNELLVLALGGLAAVFATLPSGSRGPAASAPAGLVLPRGAEFLPLGTGVAAGATALAVPFGLWPLFWVFAKIGAVLFGSGYVLLAFLRADLVQRLGWLTERQLLDAVAVGQVTPGPVFTTATFIGYVLGGTSGAAVATAGIFLPAFLFVAASGPLVPHLRRSRVVGAVLDGVNVASLALMALVTWQLTQTALVDAVALVLTVVSVVLLLRYRVNSAWLVLGGGLLGALLRY
ncbi:MAG: chromate efflux transporter [Gemmatimonadetes bacterium]|nr:chromate efflux transporter [Gemmatimonadota bacterium]